MSDTPTPSDGRLDPRIDPNTDPGPDPVRDATGDPKRDSTSDVSERGGPPPDERSPGATSRTGVQLTRAVQIGIVVRDVEQAARRLTDLFGIGPFRFIEWPNRPDAGYWYRGEPQAIRIRQAFAQAGALELELIQPLEGDRNGYREFLDRHGPGIHHVLFETGDMQGVVNAVAPEGVGVLQAGTGIRPGTRWSLLDSVEAVGFLLELRQVAPDCDGTSIPQGAA